MAPGTRGRKGGGQMPRGRVRDNDRLRPPSPERRLDLVLDRQAGQLVLGQRAQAGAKQDDILLTEGTQVAQVPPADRTQPTDQEAGHDFPVPSRTGRRSTSPSARADASDRIASPSSRRPMCRYVTQTLLRTRRIRRRRASSQVRRGGEGGGGNGHPNAGAPWRRPLPPG